MSKILLVLTFCISTGCGESAATDSDAVPADGVELSSQEKTQSESKDADPDKKKKKKKLKLYTHRLPTDMQPHQVTGLEVVLRANSPPAPEGYYIDLFAVQPAKDKKEKPRRLPLGGQDVFKPLKKGETTTVYLKAPPKDAWLQGKYRAELQLGFQIIPAHPKREKPGVTLRIVEVKVMSAK